MKCSDPEIPSQFMSLSLGHTLNEFVQHAALPYLENDSPDVRQAAAMTCSKLFVRDPICHQTSTHSIEIISDVLDKLLTVAIADPGELFEPYEGGCRADDGLYDIQTSGFVPRFCARWTRSSIAIWLRQKMSAPSSSLSTMKYFRTENSPSESSAGLRPTTQPM